MTRKEQTRIKSGPEQDIPLSVGFIDRKGWPGKEAIVIIVSKFLRKHSENGALKLPVIFSIMLIKLQY